MKSKEHATFLLELFKAHMLRFDNTRKIQWTFNALFWTGILIIAPYLKGSYKPDLTYILFSFFVLTAYTFTMYLFQRSLDWDKDKFKEYRKAIEGLIDFSSTIKSKGDGFVKWIALQTIITFLLLVGVGIFLYSQS